MANSMANFIRFLGIDRAIGYGVLTWIWTISTGPVTILLIASYFSRIQQGYYYTFSSLLAMQVFFELGLLTVIAQFASHEFAHLTWGHQGRILGDKAAHGRLFDLLSKAVKWYTCSALLIVIILIPAGLAFFAHTQSTAPVFDWQLPWALAVLGVAGNLLLIPFYAVILGSGDAATVNKRELLGGIAGSIVLCVVLLLHGGLYAIAAASYTNFIVGACYLLLQKSELLKSAMGNSFLHSTNRGSISWRNEIWPMQWKIALSWIAGFFIFQLFTPVLFRYHGAEVAGQMGLTLNASNALFGISLVWMQSRSPEFGKHIALKKWGALDTVFLKTLSQSTAVAVSCAILFTSGIWVLQTTLPLGERFLPYTQSAMVFGAACCNVIVNGLALYMRAHKTEPMLFLSLVGAILIGGSTLVLGKHYASLGVSAGYLVLSSLYGIPSTLWLWNKFRRKYHNEY